MNESVYKDCLEEKINNGKDFWGKLAEKYGYEDKEKLRNEFRRESRRRNRATENGDVPVEMSESEITDVDDFVQEVKEDGSILSDRLIEICEEDIKDSDKLLLAHKFDPKKWQIISCKNSLWHGQTKEGEKVFYQSKLFVKPKSMDETLSFGDIDKFFAGLKSKCDFKIEPIHYESTSGKTVEICLADAHLGDSFVEKDDILKILHDNLSALTEKLVQFSPEKIYLVLLGDILNYDTFKRTTTSGTVLDHNSDSVYENFDKALKLFIDIIDGLRLVAEVEVVNVYGNHDKTNSYFLAKSLECYFRDTVKVDAGYSSRKYRVIYNNLVGFCHGDDVSKDNMFGWLQNEAREAWGKTKRAEIHTGHYHTQSVIEKHGIVVRHLAAISPTNAWSYDKGYVGNVRSVTTFVWSENGLEEQWFQNL